MPDADGNVIVQTDDGKVVQYNVGDLVVDGSSESTGSAEGVNETKEPEPVGVGFFGNIYNQFKGKVKDAIDFLLRNKEGEASGALHHRDIGDISVVYGTDSYGLAHIAKKHPEVLNDLQGTIEGMAITSQSDNRIVLESPTHRAVISKMLGDKFTSDWLLTAYEKKNPASASSSDIETEPEGKQNGTATLQNEISANKVSENVVENQGNNAKTGAQPTSDPSGTGATSPKTGEEWVIPTDAKGEPMYESASVEATINDIYNDPDLDEEEADALVAAKIAGATKRIAQLEKKKPKMGEDEDAYIAERAKWREQLEAEQASLAYWQGVQSAVPEMRRKERARQQMEADMAQREQELQKRAEEAQRAEERGRNRGDYRKAMTQWEDAPSSFHEYVAQALLVGDYKMRWNDSGSTRGLGSHTTGRRGMNRRGEVVTARNDESRAMGWLIDDRTGLSPEALADKLWNEYTGSYGEDMAEGSPLDVLLDVVTSMPTPRAMWEYVKGEYDARMEAEQGAYEQQYSEEEIEAMERDAMYREKYGVSEDEYWAQEAQWDEFIESRYMSAEELRNYDNFVAEQRIKEENERRNQENAEDEQRTDNSESEGGVGLLPGEQSDNNRGNGVVTGESEGVDGNSAQSNDIAQEETAELSEEDRQAIENMPIPMLKQQIKETVVSLVNVSQLSDTWQEENKDKIERARLILAYAKQELARKEQLKKSNKWGIKVGNTATPFDVMRKMFEEFNSNEDIAQLFEKVAKVFETLPIKIVFSDTIGAKGTQGWFSPTTGTLKLPGHFVYGGRVTEQSKAETMLHEMIHAVTTYALYINEKPYLQTELGFELSDDMHAAIRQLKRIYSAIANDKDFKGEYGATSVHEMVAELSNVQFREKLKKKGLWETIVDAIKQLFGITPSNALEGAEAALEYMLNNFDRSQWDKMAGMGQKQGKQMRIGVDKMVSEDIDINPLLNVVKTLYTKGKEFASKLFSRSFFDVAKTPDFMKQLGLRGDKFTIRYGVIARHVGKDGSHDLSEKDWERLPKALQTPFAITKLNNKKDSYRIYTTLQTEKGEYIVVGVEVKNAGRDLEVNAVSTAFGRRTDANLPTNEDVIYTDTNITPDQSSLLERPNFAQYPTDQELSTDKVSDNIGDVQGLEDYSAEEIKEIAREYIEDVIAESGFDAEVVDLAIYGSRRRGDAREDSDLDIVVEYSGNVSEDGLFNALNDAETQLEINGVKVDINPITKSKSGTLGEFMERAREYDEGNESNGSTKESQPLSRVATAPLSEQEGSLEDDGLLFRDGDVFYSNAEEAVRGIKQEKATPEQWLAMIQKNGGLKAGEDKWLGLSDWLKSSTAKTLTKQEVLDYIAQNKIVIEEVGYGGDSMASAQSEFDELTEELGGYGEAFEEMVNRYGDDFRMAVWYDEVGQLHFEDGYEDYGEILGIERGINPTRMDYTTEGLENKKEIALVVPSVDPYRANDEIHFGDAGGGRAVAWVRFGETRVPRQVRVVRKADEFDAPYKNANGEDVFIVRGSNKKDYIAHAKLKNGMERYLIYVDGKLIGTTLEDTFDTIEEAQEAMNRYYAEHPVYKTVYGNVLVIDEIQSKRHQDGREAGYRPTYEKQLALAEDAFEESRKRYEDAVKKHNSANDALLSKYGIGFDGAAESELQKLRNAYEDMQLAKETMNINKEKLVNLSRGERGPGIPDAPFDKNWHELAMKRMLRYAAENGFDKVAWTTGEQQAERYDLSHQVSGIEVRHNNGEYNVFTYTPQGGLLNQASGTMTPEQIIETFGKDLGNKILAVEDGKNETITGEDLRIGGEGMKGFYDKMLPSFMNKYGKKWGVKVGEVTMPNIGDAGLTMHSIDVTDAMRESVMEGQPMFREGEGVMSDADVSMTNDPIAKVMGKSQRSKKQQAKFAERERKAMRSRVAELTERLHLDNVEVIENGTDLSGRKAKAKGWYDTKSGKIVISLSNHTSVADLERTLLHEAVAHHGLRGLFGKQFDTFLDNVFRNAEADIRAQIVDLAKRNGWDFRVATEEYLASLAENTNFEALENNWGWWQKIKQLFMDMLESIGWDYKGPELSDNELRYLLWRSYENMVNPGRHRSILGMAEDIAKQNELKVGNYSAEVASTSQVAEPKLTIGGIDLGNVKATNNGRKLIATTRKGHSQVFKSVYKYATEKFGAENVEYEKAKSGSIYMTVDLPNGHNVEIRFASHTPSGYSYGEIELESETKGFKWSAINGRVSANVDISFNTMTSGDLQAFLDLMNEYAENGFPQEIINELQSYRARSKEVSEALGISVDTLSEEGEVYSDGATIEAVNEQFNNELQQQIDGTLPKGHIYQLGMPSEVLLSTGIANAPIQLNSQKLLDKSSNFGHDYELSEIKDLVKAINNPIAIFAYGDKGKAQNIVVEIQHEGKNFIVGLSIRPIVGGRVLEVNSIRNVFPKDNAEWLNWIAQGKALFLNKEKIQTLIDQQRTNLADVEYLDLDSIANIIETFENPTISSEENNESSNAERDGDEGILFRNGESDGTREAYNKRVRRPNKRGDVGKWGNLSFRIREAYQDSMLSLDALQKVVMEKYGLTEIPSWMNAYMQENLMSSRNKAASDVYMRDFYNPMMKEVQALIKKGVKYEDLVNYMIAKHGLERNVVMAEREAERVANDVLPEKYQGKPLEELDLKLQNKWKEKYQEALAETRNKDYSGLTALTEEEDVATAEGKAQLMVDAFEKKEDYAKDDKVNKLWEKVNKATKATLQKTYEGGIIDADTYRQTAEMYEYYIPLRGWDTDIASDVYTYLTSSRPMLSPAMKIAHGRSSLADDPIATIGLMAESTIAQANRNAMKRAFYFFALNNPSDLVTIGKQWYIKNEVTFLPKTCPCFHFLIIDYIKITTNSHLQAKNSLLYHKVTKILTIFAVDFAIFHANITILN